MKRFVVAVMLSTFSICTFAEETPFTDDEAYSYLKPKDDSVYSNVIKSMVTNDAEASLQRNKTKNGFDLTPITVKKIVNEFEKNEIVATDKYSNKAIRIKGYIKSIGLDALKNGVITVAGEKSFAGNLVASVDKSAEWVRLAEKGGKIDVICNVSGYMMMNVAAKCDSALHVTEQIIMNEYGISEKYALPKTATGVGIAYIIKINADELGKSCGNSDEKCLKKIMGALDGDVLKGQKPDPKFSMWAKKLPEVVTQR